MQRWLHKILLLLAVATIIGHSSLPHHHHEDIEDITHHSHHEADRGAKGHYDHDDNETDDHNLFSFIQLDDNYIPIKFKELCSERSISFLLSAIITSGLNFKSDKSKPYFGNYMEYPPPRYHFSKLFSRPPPSC